MAILLVNKLAIYTKTSIAFAFLKNHLITVLHGKLDESVRCVLRDLIRVGLSIFSMKVSSVEIREVGITLHFASAFKFD